MRLILFVLIFILLCGFGSATWFNEDSLIAYYKMDINSTTGVLDYSPYHNNLTTVNGIWSNIGYANGGFNFNGSQYLAGSNMSLMTGNISLSIFAWINKTAATNQMGIVCKDIDSSRDLIMEVTGGTNFDVRFYNSAGSSCNSLISTTASIKSNIWQQVGFSYNNIIGKLS